MDLLRRCVFREDSRSQEQNHKKGQTKSTKEFKDSEGAPNGVMTSPLQTERPPDEPFSSNLMEKDSFESLLGCLAFCCSLQKTPHREKMKWTSAPSTRLCSWRLVVCCVVVFVIPLLSAFVQQNTNIDPAVCVCLTQRIPPARQTSSNVPVEKGVEAITAEMSGRPDSKVEKALEGDRE